MSNTTAGLNSCAVASPASARATMSSAVSATFEPVVISEPPWKGAPIIPHGGGRAWLRLRSAVVSARARIYMASPLGFSQAGRHFYNGVLIPLVRALGYEVLDPWALTDAGKVAAVQALPYGPTRREAWRTL